MQDLKKELEEVINNFSLDHFPTKTELHSLTESYRLCSKIERSGGYIYWAKQLGLPNKPSNSKWTEDLVQEKVDEIIKFYNQDYFPTAKQFILYFGNHALLTHICKTIGLKAMAEKYGLPLKSSDSMTGWQGEDFLQTKLESLGYDVEKQSTNCPYDFVVDKVRIDCKYSKIYYGPNGGFYSFSLETKDHDCDLFCLIAEDDSDHKKFFVVPNIFVFNQSQISIGLYSSKYDKYLNRFDFIDKFKNFYKELI